MKTLKFSISTPTGHKFEKDDVTLVTADLLEGMVGIMADHTPLISSLKVSIFSLTDKDNNKIYGVVKGGIFNVSKDEVIILTTNFCFKEEINIDEIENELKATEFKLQDSETKEHERKSLEERKKYALLKKEMTTR